MEKFAGWDLVCACECNCPRMPNAMKRSWRHSGSGVKPIASVSAPTAWSRGIKPRRLRTKAGLEDSFPTPKHEYSSAQVGSETGSEATIPDRCYQ